MTPQIAPIILIAEDDPDDTLMLRDAFAEIGEDRLMFLENGKILIEYLDELIACNKSPLLIIVDLNMPILDGRTVIKRIKSDKKTAKIPLIVLSTIKNGEEIQQVLSIGANDFFTKPSTFQELINITSAISKKWLE